MVTPALSDIYQLDREISFGWEPVDIIDPQHPPLLTFSNAFNCAIVNKIQAFVTFVIAFYEKYPKSKDEALNQGTIRRNLTPLHFAAISGNMEAAEALLKAGANPNAQDISGWTPLHHAALLGNRAMLALLKEVTKTDIRNQRGGTYQDILRLAYPPKSDPKQKINLLWQENGNEEQLTVERFTKLTGAEYIDEVMISPEELCADWAQPTRLEGEIPFPHTLTLRTHYQEYRKKPPMHLLCKITEDSQGRALHKSPGKGLKATRPYLPGEIIGEYVGVHGDENKNSYRLHQLNAGRFRNGMAHINDSFPNVFMVYFENLNGLPKRYVLIAAEEIKKGDEFCWSYGFHDIKLGPYQNLRVKELRAFFQKVSLTKLFEDSNSMRMISKRWTIERSFSQDKFAYLLSTPTALFLLIFEGIIEPKLSQLMYALALKVGFIPADAPKHIATIPTLAITCLNIRKQLRQCLPQTEKLYSEYVIQLSERLKTSQFVVFAEDINEYFTKKLAQLNALNIDLSTNQNLIDNKTVQIFKEQIIVGCEEAIKSC